MWFSFWYVSRLVCRLSHLCISLRNKDSNWLKEHIGFLEKRNSSEMTLD